jgi:hypothetical protein
MGRSTEDQMTTKTSFAVLFGTLFVSTAAFAAADFATVDANADAMATWEEVAAAAPDISEERFKAADADGNGSLSADEYTALMAQ